MPRNSKFILLLLAGLLGPTIALLVTWWPPVSVTRIGGGTPPAAEQIEGLRQSPSDALLAEMRSMGTGAPIFDELNAPEVLRIANATLAGKGYVNAYGMSSPVSAPFAIDATVTENSTAGLRICSLVVPSLLTRAYAVSGDMKYLDAAVAYVLDWSEFEAKLWLPKGLVFNDHATAARAIVVTEVWRLYRQSELYQPDRALALLRYVQKLMRLLREDRLYEYRTNHGLMQTLSLLHLSTAFPLLSESEPYARVGVDRLLTQLDYFISAEGVILENSPGYHRLFLQGLASAWRYLGLRGVPVPAEFRRRYRKAIEFDRAMRRPDDTLPPIGDTGDAAYSPSPLATFDERGVVSGALTTRSDENLAPPALTLTPATGYAIAWQGLQRWPAVDRLGQTVLHWNDFPTRAHKHADELGLSIWAGGSQWVTAIGYWPFDATRQDAIGWRSSNAPHWLGESAISERSASLLAYSSANELLAFDVIRRSPQHSWIRRQLVQPGELTWTVVDTFHGDAGSAAEIIWRFPPDVMLRQVGQRQFRLQKQGRTGAMAVSFAASGQWSIEADQSGDASWNSGLISASVLTPSPALRVSTNAADPVIAAVFEWQEAAPAADAASTVELRWEGPENWLLSDSAETAPGFTVERVGNELTITGSTGTIRRLAMSPVAADSATESMRESVATYDAATQRYGRPFAPMFERRAKVTKAIVAATLLQLLVFLAIPARFRRWQPHVTGVTVFGWLGLAVLIHGVYLA